MKTFKLTCPACGNEDETPMLDYLTNKPIEELPVNDFTLCPKCVTLCTIEEGGGLHETVQDEVRDMPLEFWAAIAEAKAHYQANNPDAKEKAECPVCFNRMVGIGLGLKCQFKVGDTGMCMYCGSWLTIDDEKLNLRWASEEEVAAVPDAVKEMSWNLRARQRYNQ